MTDKNIDSNLIRGKVTLRRAENRETLLPLAFPLNHSPTIEHGAELTGGEGGGGGKLANGSVNVSPFIRNRIDRGNSSIVLPSPR